MQYRYDRIDAMLKHKDKIHIPSSMSAQQAIIVTSGNANACTGRKGLEDAAETASLTAESLKINPSLVYVCSTGVIGTPMPMEKIKAASPVLTANLGRSSPRDIPSAVMTTDNFPKVITKKVRIENRTGTIAGICKGAGMIAPNMATMLCFILTDIAVEKRTLIRAIKDAVKDEEGSAVIMPAYKRRALCHDIVFINKMLCG
ncbi:bifunctional ornithine acetyltransferase/N-acetylglutamate synthase [Candidatus Hakubella thermalkaliphila]|nr:bifunctional ornithine acetyltransferase/N-acetylglutamate synthase [Candidatus Hakubella thermalkaliphila]